MSHRLPSRLLDSGAIGLGLALAACTTTNKTPADTTATAAAQAGTPAKSSTPAQSVALLAGTWKGITLAQGRDTVVGSWTFHASGDSATVTFPNGQTVPVHHIRATGDSIRSDMGPWTSPTDESKGKPVTGEIVEQVRGDSLEGTVVSHLVAKPDSVTARVRIRGARVKP